MKALTLLLKSEGIDTDSLRVLFKQDGATTFALTADAYDLPELWVRLRDLVPKTQRWPRLVGDDYPTNGGQFYADGEEPSYPRYTTILKKADKIDFPAWLAQRHEEHLESMREQLASSEEGEDKDEIRFFRSMFKGDEEFHGL